MRIKFRNKRVKKGILEFLEKGEMIYEYPSRVLSHINLADIEIISLKKRDNNYDKQYNECYNILKNFDFISKEIIDMYRIISNINSYKIKNMTIHIYSDNTCHNILDSKLLTICNWLLKYKPNHKCDIHIVLIPVEKYIDHRDKHKILTYKNINSGVSSTNGYNNTVVVFRSTEVEKVLIHELIHSLSLDLQSIDYRYNLDIVIYGNNKILVNEGITECLAIYLYNYYLIEISKYDNKRLYFNILMMSDILNTIYNCEIIKRYYGMNSYTRNELRKFNQKTNVYSYIFIKLFLMLNEEMIKKLLLRQENKNEIIQYINNYSYDNLQKIDIDIKDKHTIYLSNNYYVDEII